MESLICQLPVQTLTIAIAGSSQCFANAHEVYCMMNRCTGNETFFAATMSIIIAKTNSQNFTNTRQTRDNENVQQGNSNNQNNADGNNQPPLNGNNPNVWQRQAQDNNLTDECKEALEQLGFLYKSRGRFETFVHEFPSLENKVIYTYYFYKHFVCKNTDNGGCRFAHIKGLVNYLLRTKIL